MIFTQGFDTNNMAIDKEFEKICAAHPECINCPLKDRDMNIQNSVVRCETGRRRGN